MNLNLNDLNENCISMKNDGNPISVQECAWKETKFPKNEKYVSCYDERREGIIALGQAYTLGHITGMKEGRMVI